MISYLIVSNAKTIQMDEKITKDRALEKTMSLSLSRDCLEIDGMGDRINPKEVEEGRSGGLVLSIKKKGGKAIPFYSIGRKSWVHILMVLVLIFVQSKEKFALGKEIEVDEEGSVVDLTVQNQGRNLVSFVLFGMTMTM